MTFKIINNNNNKLKYKINKLKLSSIIVVYTTVPITKDCIRILMEATPYGFNIIEFK